MGLCSIVFPLLFSDSSFCLVVQLDDLWSVKPRGVVHFVRLFILILPLPAVVLSYPKRVLFPPSFTLIGYPLEIRAHGHDTLRLALWFALDMVDEL